MGTDLKIKIVIFSVLTDKLHVYLPGGSLPYGRIIKGASLNKIAMKIVEDIVGKRVKDTYLEQLYTFSYPDPKSTGVDVVYFILLPDAVVGEEHKDHWVNCQHIAKRISEYSIITYAIQRLRWKIEYTNVVYSLLPKNFTLSELQNIYEAIIGKKIDKRNFRKKILSLRKEAYGNLLR